MCFTRYPLYALHLAIYWKNNGGIKTQTQSFPQRTWSLVRSKIQIFKNLTNNCDTATTQEETVCIREDTEERKSILYTKNDSTWKNVTALTWAPYGASVPQVECYRKDDEYFINTPEKQIKLNLENNEIRE